MSFIHIKRQVMTDGDGQQVEQFAVQSMAIQSPQGKKLIPNPAGKEAAVFETMDAAVAAVRHAGFDYIFEGQKVFLNQPAAVVKTRQSLSGGFVNLQDAVPILLDRLNDREPSVVSQAAFALGNLLSDLSDTSHKQAITLLIDILGHEDPTVRRTVAEALAKIGPETLPYLYQAYENAQISKDKNAAHLRLTVIQTYQEMTARQKPLTEAFIPQAITALEDDSWLVRSAAAQLIGLMAATLKADELGLSESAL